MNKKYAIVSIVLIALMSLSLIPIGAFAFHTPSSSDDLASEYFGPRPSQLVINIYTDYAAELAGFKNKEFDVMDWALDPVDYQWFETNDPNHAQYSTAFEAEFGLYEYDTQDQVLPTSIVSFRQAISYMLDKDYFIKVNLPNAAAKADSPIAAITGWYNPALTDLFNLQPRTVFLPIPNDPADWQAAYNLLVADMGSPIPDPESPGFFTWTWPSPFPTADPDGLVNPVPNGHLLVFARSDSNPARLAQGQYLKDCLMTAMPNILPTLGLPKAQIHVDLYNVPRAVTSKTVMQEYWFHYYSGGWSLSRDPDFLQYYQSGQITKPLPNAHNYPCYSNVNYDTEVDAMLASPAIGSVSNPSDGLYHAYSAQQIFMSEAGIVPFWTYAGYKATLANWRGVVNTIGFGVNSWFTFLNAHKVGSVGNDVIKYGWQGDLVSLNAIGATWLWDWEVLNKVYDSLIAVNPYNMANDVSYITQGWTIGTWAGPSGTATMLTFNIREDVYWQDVPFKDRSAITVGTTHAIDGPFQGYRLTPLDVAFSFEYQRDNAGANSAYLMDNLDHVEMAPEWAAMWPASQPGWYNQIAPPWQTNFAQGNAALGDDTLVVKLSTFMPWLGLHRIGGVPLIPMHIWSQIPMIGSEVLDTWGNDIVYGTGPYILLSRNPGVSMVMIPFKTGASYRGVINANSYFWGPFEIGTTESDYTALNGVSIYFGDTIVNKDTTNAYTFDYYFDYTVELEKAANPGVWIPLGTGNTPTSSGAFAVAGPPVYVEKDVFILPQTGPNAVKWGDHVRWQESLHVVITSGPAWAVGMTDVAMDNAPPTTLWSDGEEYVHIHTGDIAGHANVEVYARADGKCDIKDATAIGFNWAAHTVPPASKLKNDAIRSADINNDNVIDIKDATAIGLNWGKTWTYPTTPPS